MQASLTTGLESTVTFDVTREQTIDFMGMAVTITVRIQSLEGRAVVFDIEGRDAVEPIVRGQHARFIVDVAKTAQRLAAKAHKATLI